ncbi:hypothetical protein [Amantichitinum ursilacus]|uniref:Uncharacterized protein n=1 Tax=Amantichitinum ursilacus TaxID=857265 RepID=A0A0N0GLU7_9NEIS|nr:hypothetical protein [Amantichitinum ursilacus]KPC50396.1 hypothetical protein WG78_17350 [Amantichitinum ursilacus]
MSRLICIALAGIAVVAAPAWAGSRDAGVDALFFSISPTKNPQLEASLDAFLGYADPKGEGAKARDACRVNEGRSSLEFGEIVGGAGTTIKKELSKDDVWKAIAGNPKAQAKLNRVLSRHRRGEPLYLPYGFDQMIAYAIQPDGHVKFWAMGQDDDHLLTAESRSAKLSDIAGPLCSVISKIGLTHSYD